MLDSGLQPQVQAVDDLQAELSEVFKGATASYVIVREQQRQRSTSQFALPSYQVGDQVMLDTAVVEDPYSRERPSVKLKYKRIGPFKIIRLIGRNAVELLLPSTLRIHPVVNVSHTTRHFEQTSDIRSETTNTPLPPINPAYPDEFEVDRILRHRKHGNNYEFLVAWKGYPTHDSSWEPRRHFIYDDESVHDSLTQYIREHNLHDAIDDYSFI